MDDVLNFVTDNMKKIDNTKYIKIGISKPIVGIQICDSNIKSQSIEKILSQLYLTDFSFKINKSVARIYKYLQMTYIITETSHTNYQNTIIIKQDTNLNENNISISLIDRETLPLETFPNKNIYHDIINHNKIKIIINNIYILHINIEENCRKKFISLNIEINKQNIYMDKVRKDLKTILNIIIGNL